MCESFKLKIFNFREKLAHVKGLCRVLVVNIFTVRKIKYRATEFMRLNTLLMTLYFQPPKSEEFQTKGKIFTYIFSCFILHFI